MRELRLYEITYRGNMGHVTEFFVSDSHTFEQASRRWHNQYLSPIKYHPLRCHIMQHLSKIRMDTK